MTDPLAPHPDDEALSALHDGEAGAADRDHVADCTRCQHRLAGLEAVSRAVAAPVTADGPGIEAAVAAALAEGTAPTTPIAAIGGRRRSYRPPAAWVGVAALVLVLLAIVPLLLRDGDDRDLSTAAGRVKEESAQTRAGVETLREGSAASSGAGVGGAGGGVAVTDFGEHDDTATLVALLATDQYAAPAPPNEAAASDGGDAQADSGAAAGGEPATTCVEEGRRISAGRAQNVVALGPVRWRGEHAVVVVFAVDPSASGGDRQLYVMSRSGCDVLAERRF